MRHAAAAVLCLLVAACAKPPVLDRGLFSDHLFAAPAEPPGAEDVFALSPEMRRYLETEMAASLASKGLHRGLIDALYSTNRLRLDYDVAVTRSAAEAFAARSGNCLSLVIMTAAFAKALGLDVHYQGAYVEPTWSRAGGMHFLSGHVNIRLGGPSTGSRIRTAYDMGESLIVDFLPSNELRGLRTWPLGESTVVAMYLNNRAAEALARGETAQAYWWVRAALERDPGFFSAYNTLGVVYLRHGAWAEAERVLRLVLEHESGNTQALSNLSLALQRLGREAESQALERRLARIEPHPAFHFFDRGLAAMRAGDFRAARELFAKELDRDSDYHELHFWLAMANLKLGDIDRARKHLDLAMQNSITRDERGLYAAKLERLRALR